MPGTEHENEAVRVYRRVLGEVAENRAVASAEDVIADVWIDELERARRGVLESADGIGDTDRAARERESLRRARELGDPAALARAREQRGDLRRMRLVLEAVDTELGWACRAVLERTRRGREDISRLSAAWIDAYGG
jgi:hypothetical protein